MAEAVVAIEPDDGLRATAQTLLDDLEVINAAVSAGDPAAGDPPHGPYDVIFVNGMVQRMPPALTAQLKDGGRLVAIFDAGGVGKCRVLTRAGSGMSERTVFDASAPLVPGFGQASEFVF
jgi:protein-L-isoaspartate(D-aspartate) O-methyltransferase